MTEFGYKFAERRWVTFCFSFCSMLARDGNWCWKMAAERLQLCYWIHCSAEVNLCSMRLMWSWSELDIPPFISLALHLPCNVERKQNISSPTLCHSISFATVIAAEEILISGRQPQRNANLIIGNELFEAFSCRCFVFSSPWINHHSLFYVLF